MNKRKTLFPNVILDEEQYIFNVFDYGLTNSSLTKEYKLNLKQIVDTESKIADILKIY